MKEAPPALVCRVRRPPSVNVLTTLTGMIMDWRQMAGRPTVIGMPIGERWWAWSGGRKVGYGWKADQWDGTMDPMRGWIIAFCWIVACFAE